MLKKLIEKYRFIKPVFASMIVFVCGIVVYSVGVGYDYLFGESYPLFVYPTLSDLTVGDLITIVLVLAFIIGIASYQLSIRIHEAKTKKEA